MFQSTPAFGRSDNVPGIGRSTPFSAAAFDLEAGQTTAPVRVGSGWAILRLAEIEEPRLPEAARAVRSAGLGWLLVLAMFLLLALVLFWPSIAALAELWSHPERRTYQHGYLIGAIALWLLYRERQRIAAAVEHPSPALLVLAAIGSVAWAVAWNAGLQAAAHDAGMR